VSIGSTARRMPPNLPGMFNGEIHRRRFVVGAIALTIGGTLAACTPAETEESSTEAAATAAAPAPATFGPAGWGKITIGMTEKDALATGDLQTSPVSTVLGRTVYSYVDGPKPDAERMAADEKIEARVKEADEAGPDRSAQEYADDAQAYADSTKRMADRLVAYLEAGGATFEKGALTSIAAPAGAVTEAGIKRGSTVAELKTAYEGKGLKEDSKTAYTLPIAGHDGWTILFELDGDTVKYMSMGGPN
jgi:hypothetical protein